MKQRPLTVEFRLPPTGTSPVPKTLPGEKAERQRQERAARKARNLALAYYIDSLIRSGEVANLAAVARMCGVSRSRLSVVTGIHGLPVREQEAIVRTGLQRLRRP